MTFQKLEALIVAYREGRLGSEELETLIRTLQQEEFPEEWSAEISRLLQQPPGKHTIDPARDKEIWRYIETHTHTRPVAPVRFIPRKIISWVAAAAMIICIAGYFFLQRSDKSGADTVSRQLIDAVKPATNGAVLILEDGTKMELDSMGNGIIASQKGAHLTLKNGSLIYNADKEKEPVTTYNTLQTPKGRQFNIQLPDGSRIWLNAASSIKYPVAFLQRERRVEVDGEAYFEVAPDKSKPFIVNIRNVAEVKVVGTHFNVNAYNDEPALATTLLSGVVEVRSLDQSQAGKPVRMLPGQQARISEGSNDIKLVSSADTSEVMSWKNGMFNFNEASLQQVMRQIGRWYDLTIEYKGGAPDMKFGGKMGRNLKLTDVLKFLEGARVRFKMEEENKLIVLPAK